MDYKRQSRRKPITGRVDPWLLMTTILLAGIGLVMVYSASFVRANAQYGTPLFFLKRQIIWIVFGVVIMLVTGRINYRILADKRVAFGLAIATFLMLIAVYLPPFGKLIAKTHRWLRFGFIQFQPAELAKLTAVIWLAYIANTKKDAIRSLKDGVSPMALAPMIFMALIVPQPDLGSCVIIGSMLIVMLYVAGTKLWYIGSAGLAGVLAIAIAVIAEPYRVQRVLTFLNPWADKQGKGYQIIQSLIAFGAGGVSGLGLGNGRQKLFYLPAPHTDFILANVGEELGLIGITVLFALFAFLLYRAFAIAVQITDRFGMLLATGLSCLLGFQIVINAMVVMSLLPNKGLALPFLSYGGSSALINFAVVGLLLSLSRAVDVQEKELIRRTQDVRIGEVAL